MYFVYFLKSIPSDRIYVGSTENIQNRLERHNKGYIRSTKGYRPWELLGCEEFKTRSDAVKRERFLKTGQQKELLRKKYL